MSLYVPIYIWKTSAMWYSNTWSEVMKIFAAVLEGYNYFNDDQDQHDFMFLKMFHQSSNSVSN
jgi:hypothetical protein